MKDLKRQKDGQVGQLSVQQHLEQSNRHEGGKRRERRKDKDVIHSALGRGCHGYSRRPARSAGRQTHLGRLTAGDEGFWTVTYAVAVCLHVRGVPVVRVRGGRAAPAGGCRVGRRSGDDHVVGRLRGLKSQQDDMTRAHGGGGGVVRSTWKHF